MKDNTVTNRERELLKQQRDQLKAELTAIQAAHPAGELPADVQTRWDQASTEHRAAADRLERQHVIDDMDRRAAGQPLDGSGDRRLDELRASVSLSDIIRSQLRDTRDLPGSGRARELSAELARQSGRAPAHGLLWDARAAAPGYESRIMSTGKQGSVVNDGVLVPTIQQPGAFIDLFRASLVVERAGATVLSGLSGDIAIPRRVTSVQPAFVLENEPLPLTDATFDQVRMAPKTAGCVTEISRNLAMQSSPSAEALVRDDMAKTLAELIDRAALLGDGTGALPLGVVPQAGTTTYASTGSPSWDQVLQQVDALETANVMPTAWIIGPGVRRKLMQAPRSATVAEGYLMPDMNTLAAVGVLQTGIMMPGSLLLGDFSQLVVGYWSAVEIVVNEFAQDAFMKGNLLVRAIVSMDVALRRASAFRALVPVAS